MPMAFRAISMATVLFATASPYLAPWNRANFWENLSAILFGKG